MKVSIVKRSLVVFGMLFVIGVSPMVAIVRATTTSISVTPQNSVVAGTVVTLTASVSNPSGMTPGLVKFCDALAVHCSDSAILGTATAIRQSQNLNIASIKLRLGVGTHNISAVVMPTATVAGSTSQIVTITVTPSQIYQSSTSLAVAGSTGHSTLSGAVSGTGIQTLTGNIRLLDASKSNTQIGSLSLNVPSRSFAPSSTYAVPGDSVSDAVGDFNGDGIPDLAVSNYDDSTVSVLFGNGDGTFQPRVAYATGTNPWCVTVGDFNGDGISDLVTNNLSSNDVSVLLGKADGTFQAKASYATGQFGRSIAVSDFNRDGNLDLAVVNADNGGSVSVLLGNGDGTFQTQTIYPSGGSWSIVAGDFNGDGTPDLAVADASTASVAVLMGNGDGTFQTRVNYLAGNTPHSVVIGDFNDDGVLDLAVANYDDSTVSVLLGNGDGTFQSQVLYATGSNPWSVAIGDVNGDGITDLVAGSSGGNSVSVLMGNGDGTFQPQLSYESALVPIVVGVSDFNGDGISDIAILDFFDNGLSVLVGGQTATYTFNEVTIPGSGTHNVIASYSGDSSRTVSSSSSVPVDATPATTRIVLALAPNPASTGTNVTFLASLSMIDGIAPTGVVTFNDSGVSIGTAVLSNASATLVISTLGAGAHTITAVFGGDDNYLDATSTTSTLMITELSTVLISASPNPSVYGSFISFVATVPPLASGVVTFMDGSNSLGTGVINAGTATLAIGSLSVGPHSITAVYGGDSNFTGSTSPPLIQVISKAPVSLGVISSIQPSLYGDLITFQATVTIGATGSITFADGETTLGTVPIVSGVATLTPSLFVTGVHTVTATFSGDSNYY